MYKSIQINTKVKLLEISKNKFKQKLKNENQMVTKRPPKEHTLESLNGVFDNPHTNTNLI